MVVKVLQQLELGCDQIMLGTKPLTHGVVQTRLTPHQIVEEDGELRIRSISCHGI